MLEFDRIYLDWWWVGKRTCDVDAANVFPWPACFSFTTKNSSRFIGREKKVGLGRKGKGI